MSELIRFGKGTISAATISPERQLIYAQADNLQLIEAMLAIVDAASSVPGAEFIKITALFALARSAMP